MRRAAYRHANAAMAASPYVLARSKNALDVAELAVAVLRIGEHEKGQRGIEQQGSQSQRDENMRAIERGAGYEPVAQMTREQHDSQQSKVRDEVEQKISHVDGMKAQRFAALPKRLLTQRCSVMRRIGGDHCTSLCLNKYQRSESVVSVRN